MFRTITIAAAAALTLGAGAAQAMPQAQYDALVERCTTTTMTPDSAQRCIRYGQENYARGYYNNPQPQQQRPQTRQQPVRFTFTTCYDTMGRQDAGGANTVCY